MSERKRKIFSGELKAKVALEAIRGIPRNSRDIYGSFRVARKVLIGKLRKVAYIYPAFS